MKEGQYETTESKLQNNTKQKVRDSPEIRQQKQKVVLLGRRIFFSNFLTGSLILLYLMLVYAILTIKADCQGSQMITLLVIMGLSDVIMIVQHFISFFAMINHSDVGLIGCIIAHSFSIILKIIGGIMILNYAQTACDFKSGLAALPFSAVLIELVYTYLYIRLMRLWQIIAAPKWRKQFTLVRKPQKVKSHPINQPMNPQEYN